MIYRYCVEYISEEDDTKTKRSVGFCEAEDYTRAIQKLLNYFGETYIVEFKKLKLVGDCNIIELASSEKLADNLRQAEDILDEYEKNFVW